MSKYTLSSPVRLTIARPSLLQRLTRDMETFIAQPLQLYVPHSVVRRAVLKQTWQYFLACPHSLRICAELEDSLQRLFESRDSSDFQPGRALLLSLSHAIVQVNHDFAQIKFPRPLTIFSVITNHDNIRRRVSINPSVIFE